MYSELNIDVLEGLMDAPKPRQIYFGATVRNCLGVEISECRRAVLEKSDMDFPEACILDTTQPYTGQAIDYAYVDDGPADLTDFQRYCFYNEPMWYHRRAF